MDIKKITEKIQYNPIVEINSYVDMDLFTKLPLYISTQIKEEHKVVICKPNKLSYNYDKNHAAQLEYEGSIISADSISSDWDNKIVYTETNIYVSVMYQHYIKKKNKDVPVCDILIVGGGTLQDINTQLLFYVWRHMGAKGYKIPRLVIIKTSDCEIKHLEGVKKDVINISREDKNPMELWIEKDIPFEKRGTECAKTVKEYHISNPMLPNSISVWLIFASNQSEVKHITNILSDLKDVELISLYLYNNKDRDFTNFWSLPTYDKRRIIITDSVAGSCSIKADMVFDTMTRYSSGRLVSATYFDSMNSYAHATMGIWRCCKKSNIQKYQLILSSNEIIDTILNIVSIGMNPIEFYKNIGATKESIKNVIDIINSFNIITFSSNSYKLTECGKFIKDLNNELSLLPLLILYNLLHRDGYLSLMSIKHVVALNMSSKYSGKLEDVLSKILSKSKNQAIEDKSNKIFNIILNNDIKNNKLSKHFYDIVKDVYKHTNILYLQDNGSYFSPNDRKKWILNVNNKPKFIYLIHGGISKTKYNTIYNDIKVWLE